MDRIGWDGMGYARTLTEEGAGGDDGEAEPETPDYAA